MPSNCKKRPQHEQRPQRRVRHIRHREKLATRIGKIGVRRWLVSVRAVFRGRCRIGSIGQQIPIAAEEHLPTPGAHGVDAPGPAAELVLDQAPVGNLQGGQIQAHQVIGVSLNSGVVRVGIGKVRDLPREIHTGPVIGCSQVTGPHLRNEGECLRGVGADHFAGIKQP